MHNWIDHDKIEHLEIVYGPTYTFYVVDSGFDHDELCDILTENDVVVHGCGHFDGGLFIVVQEGTSRRAQYLFNYYDIGVRNPTHED